MSDDVIERHRETLEKLAANADEHYEKYGIRLGLDARRLLEEHDD